jgi:hypothetical protein
MADYAHLAGYGEFDDVVAHVRIAGFMELYADKKKAIFRVASSTDPSLALESVYRRPEIISTIYNQICMLREVNGVVDLGTDPIIDRELAMCGACGGVGWNEDADGNQIDCEWCHGEGWREE